MVSFTKLKSGEWGLRGEGLVSGARVRVEKRDGSVTSAIVGRVLWSDGTVALATIDKPAPKPAPEPAPVVVPSWEFLTLGD
jgi:hypothetical protein